MWESVLRNSNIKFNQYLFISIKLNMKCITLKKKCNS